MLIIRALSRSRLMKRSLENMPVFSYYPITLPLFQWKGSRLTADASLVANLQRSIYNKVYNHFALGLEANIEGNHDKGVSFDPLHPPMEMLGVRTRSYRDIPFVHRYAAFAEDKVTIRTGAMRTELQAGVRLNYLRTASFHCDPTVEPRINIRQVLWERKENGFLNSFSLRAGWGLMRKMPVLAYLYPDKYYTDANCFTYNDAENDERLTVLNTFVTDKTFNPHLRLPVNNKFELGATVKIKGITADIVWFKEHLRNGYCTALQAAPFTYRQYAPLTNKGEHPEWTNGGVVNGCELLPYTENTTFALYTTPQNGIEQRKEGMEYTVDLGHWHSVASSFVVSGCYMKMKEKIAHLLLFIRKWNPMGILILMSEFTRRPELSPIYGYRNCVAVVSNASRIFPVSAW